MGQAVTDLGSLRKIHCDGLRVQRLQGVQKVTLTPSTYPMTWS